MAFTVSTRFKAIDKMSKILKKIGRTGGRAMNKIKRSMAKVNQGVSAMSKKFGFASKMGATLLAGFSFAAIQGQIRDTITIGAQFEQTMISAAARFPEKIKKGTEAFDVLKKSAKDAGATTEFTAIQAGDSLAFMAKAGFTANQAMGALPGTIDLATAAETDLATASDIATDTLGAFGLAVKDSAQLALNLARVSDVMAKAANSANLDLSMMFETVKAAGPDAKAAGVEIEQFSAAAGILAQSGRKGEKAGTILKNMFLNLQAPVAKGRKALKDMKITLADQNGEMKDFADLLDELNQKLPKGVARASALKDIFGKVGMTGANILLAAGGDELRRFTGDLDIATGFTRTLADVMRDSTQGSLKQMNSAIEGLKIELFEGLQPAFEGVIKIITKFVRWVTKGYEALGPWGPVVLDVVAALGIAVTILIVLAAVIAAVSAAMVIFNIVFGANPIGLIILAIAALIFLIIQMIRNFETTKKVAKNIFKFLTEGWFSMLNPIGQVVHMIKLVGKLLKKFGFFKKKIIEVDANINVNKENVDSEGNIVTPETAQTEATTRTLRETSEVNERATAEVTIKDETGKAVVTDQTGSPGAFNLDLPLGWAN